MSNISSMTGFVRPASPRNATRGKVAIYTKSALVTNETQRVPTPPISRTPSVSCNHGNIFAIHSTAAKGRVRYDLMAMAKKK